MSQLSFFQTVTTFAKPYVKAAVVKSADPLVVAKAKFTAQCDEQTKLIKAAAEKGFWFKKVGEGYVLNLKNGAAVLKGCSFAVGSAVDAIKLLEQAKAAAAKGEFDQLLKDTARAPRKPKADAAAAPVASAPAAPVPPAPAAPVQAPAPVAAKSKRK